MRVLAAMSESIELKLLKWSFMDLESTRPKDCQTLAVLYMEMVASRTYKGMEDIATPVKAEELAIGTDCEMQVTYLRLVQFLKALS